MAGRKPIAINLKSKMVKLNFLKLYVKQLKNLDLVSVEWEKLITLVEIELVNMS